MCEFGKKRKRRLALIFFVMKVCHAVQTEFCGAFLLSQPAFLTQFLQSLAQKNSYFHTFDILPLFEIILILVAIIACIPLLFIRQMSFYVLNDNPDIPANQCYDITAKLVKQNFGKVLLLNLSFIGWWLLVLLTLGALNVYVAPYYKTSVANLYLSLKGTVVKP